MIGEFQVVYETQKHRASHKIISVHVVIMMMHLSSVKHVAMVSEKFTPIHKLHQLFVQAKPQTYLYIIIDGLRVKYKTFSFYWSYQLTVKKLFNRQLQAIIFW